MIKRLNVENKKRLLNFNSVTFLRIFQFISFQLCKSLCVYLIIKLHFMGKDREMNIVRYSLRNVADASNTF